MHRTPNSQLSPGAEASGSTDVSAGHEWRRGRFPNLMERRIERILLVSCPYDAFILEEDGLLSELIFSEYTTLGLTHAPHVQRVSTAGDALVAIGEERFDLVITMLRVGEMDVSQFTETVHDIRPELPVVLLIANELELNRLGDRRWELGVDGIYVWQGDAKLFLAIIKEFEDRWNSAYDTQAGGVGVIILIEDSVRYRSSLLPTLYSELVQQTRRVMQEGLNQMQRMLRLRARPKLLVAETYEQGVAIYEKYRDYLFGIITDVRFPRDGSNDPEAGAAFVELARQQQPDIPALLQSSDPSNHALAERVHASFLYKRSTTLLQDIREFMLDNFGFGDFVFRGPDGEEVGRADDLVTMKRLLREVPVESILYHAQRNHFSNWLRARTEFVLARRLRPRRVSEFSDLESMRNYLVESFEEALRYNRSGVVEDFKQQRFDSTVRFARIGGGSLGGKARGLAFFDALLARAGMAHSWENVRIHVPRSVVVGTDVFDEYLEHNGLRRSVLHNASDDWIREAFLESRLPDHVRADLSAYLAEVRYPIAVRSSSMLEDSQYHPFAGVYDTHMIANNAADEDTRLDQLAKAIKLVFASMFFTGARRYLRSTPHRIEEQKMAVILQELVGSRHEDVFYPDFAGVVRSYNFYPFGHMQPEDGIASVALGLGHLVVEGGEALQFCPAHPQVLPQLGAPKQFMDQSQRSFYAIDLRTAEAVSRTGFRSAIVKRDLDDAERHGTLDLLGSVWSMENEALYDGINRAGPRAVTFAHILKNEAFPLAEILQDVLRLGREGMGGPVEIEFAVNLQTKPREFAVLQMRPYGAGDQYQPVDIDEVPRAVQFCATDQALGHGAMNTLRDVVYVRPETFDAAQTPAIAEEIAGLNERLRDEARPYILIGPGRWGSSNPWLGIPVTWAQISGARLIVEAGLDHFVVDPSQGSHFFHNLISVGTAYLTVNPRSPQAFIEWEWLAAQPAESETEFVRHVALPEPVEARIDGRASRAVILKRVSTPAEHAAWDTDA